MSLLGKAASAIRNDAASAPPVPYARNGYSVSNYLAGGSDPGTYMRAYGSNGTVFSIVSMLARNTAKHEWHLFRSQPVDGRRRYTTGDKGSDQRTEVIKHQAIALWRKPNPWTTGFKFRELAQTYLDLTGESYTVISRSPRATIPLSLWQVRPDRMEPVPSRDEYLLGYLYTGPNGEQIPLQPNEVIQSTYPNPFDPYHGLGPIQSILVDIDSAKYSAQWNRNFFLNSATPGGVIQVDKRLDDDEWNELTARWRETHRGVGAAHRVAVLEQGAQWVPNAHTIRDMDFAALRNVSRDVIREAFAIHKAILGTTDDVNRANAQTATEQFEQFLITDRLDRWKDILNCFYLPLFGSTGDGVELDYDDPVTSNREADALELKSKAEAAYSLVQAGYEPHGVLETVGLPDMDVVEQATQTPAVPPGWVLPDAPAALAAPEAPAADNTPDGSDADSQNRHGRRIRAAVPPPQAPDHDLDDVDRQWKAALAFLVSIWLLHVVPGQRSQLRIQIKQLVDAGETAALATLSVDSEEAAKTLLTSMTAMAKTAAQQAVAEAAKQGVEINPVEAASDLLKSVAETTAAVQGQQLATTASAEAARLAAGGDADGEDVAAKVDEFLQSLSDAAQTSRLAGALSAAQNESRIATFLAGPSADVFASEVNDKNTCGPCAAIDGEYIGNTRDENIADAIDALYPNGGYIDCAGKDRCRGSIVAAYNTDSGGSGDDNGAEDITGSLPFFLVDEFRKPLAANGHNHHEKAGV